MAQGRAHQRHPPVSPVSTRAHPCVARQIRADATSSKFSAPPRPPLDALPASSARASRPRAGRPPNFETRNTAGRGTRLAERRQQLARPRPRPSARRPACGTAARTDSTGSASLSRFPASAQAGGSRGCRVAQAARVAAERGMLAGGRQRKPLPGTLRGTHGSHLLPRDPAPTPTPCRALLVSPRACGRRKGAARPVASPARAPRMLALHSGLPSGRKES